MASVSSVGDMTIGQPKFTLVRCTDPSDQDDLENGTFIPVELHEIEGVEVEEINQEGQANECVLENNAFKAFGISSCPECENQECSRPVQECCGHIKCRRCFLSNDQGCAQCLSTGEHLLLRQLDAEKDDGQPQPSLIDIESQKNESENRQNVYYEEIEEIEDGGMEEVYIQPSHDEYILELEQASGDKSLAIVSSATLKQLGIEHSSADHHQETTVIAIDNADQPEIEIAQVSSISFEATAESPVDVPVAINSLSTSKSHCNNKRRKLKSWDHIKTLVTMPPKYKCTYCNKEFEQYPQRRSHLYCNPANGKRPFTCEICHEGFISSSHYDYHVRRKHTGEKPFGCHICDVKFFQKDKLNRHMSVHKLNRNTASNEKQFLCAYCKKRFKNLNNCKKHLRIHTGFKPHQCTTCTKSFSTKSGLDAHIRVHLNERPYKCSDTDCNLAFSTAKDLKRHFYCHTGEKPFLCDLCKQEFRRKDNLVRHIRQTHKLSPRVAKMMGNEAAEKYRTSKDAVSDDVQTVTQAPDNEVKKLEAIADCYIKTKRRSNFSPSTVDCVS